MLESRGGNRYWYADERTDGRVRRVYRGAGEAADDAAREHDERRSLRDAQRAEACLADQDYAEALAPLDDFASLLDSVTKAVLEGLNYHKHARGEWRLRRHGSQAESVLGGTAGDPGSGSEG